MPIRNNKKSDFPDEIFVRMETDGGDGAPYPLAFEGMPDEEGPIARYQIVSEGEIVVSRTYLPEPKS
jgi:hypothetical protein